MQSKRGICREEQVNEGRKRGGSSAGDLSPFRNYNFLMCLFPEKKSQMFAKKVFGCVLR